MKNKAWIQSVHSPSPEANRTGVLYFYNGILRGNVIFFFFSSVVYR